MGLHSKVCGPVFMLEPELHWFSVDLNSLIATVSSLYLTVRLQEILFLPSTQTPILCCKV